MFRELHLYMMMKKLLPDKDRQKNSQAEWAIRQRDGWTDRKDAEKQSDRQVYYRVLLFSNKQY